MILELSYAISENIPVYPGSPVEQFFENTRISNGDPSNTTVIIHYLHAGSHVDAPFHFDKDGSSIDEIPIENFMYTQPVIIQCPKKKSGLIMMEDLKPYLNELNKADIILFNTTYSQLREDSKRYCDDFPALSLEVATYIRNVLLNVKAVAIDTLSIESSVLGPKKNFEVHKMLLDHTVSKNRTLLIFEDINIEKVSGKEINTIWAFPLRLVGLDGSPVNMIAKVVDENVK